MDPTPSGTPPVTAAFLPATYADATCSEAQVTEYLCLYDYEP
jgi:hypothetical protein